MALHQNPFDRSRAVIEGERLKPGDILWPTDMYASTTGAWEKCPCPGLEVTDNGIIWVRPSITDHEEYRRKLRALKFSPEVIEESVRAHQSGVFNFGTPDDLAERTLESLRPLLPQPPKPWWDRLFFWRR